MTERTMDDPGLWRYATFHVPAGALAGASLAIDGAEGHHAVDVVRVRQGDTVRLIDGEGGEAIARVERASDSVAEVSVVESREHSRSDGVELTVVQALLKGRAFEEVVRRCSELGVAGIVPLASERAVGRVPDAAVESRVARWEAIALAAVKQSRGVFVPSISPVADLESVAVLAGEAGRALVAWEEEEGLGLSDGLGQPAPSNVLLVVGPEGGLTSAEVERLVEAGARSVGVGRRVLKADWAAAAIAAMISCEVGGLQP